MQKLIAGAVEFCRALALEIVRGRVLWAGILGFITLKLLPFVRQDFYWYFIPEVDYQATLALVFTLFLTGFWYLVISIVLLVRHGEDPLVLTSFTKAYVMAFVVYLGACYQASVSETPFWEYFVAESSKEISYAIFALFAFGIAIAFWQMGAIRRQNESLTTLLGRIRDWRSGSAEGGARTLKVDELIEGLPGGVVRSRIERFAAMARRGRGIDRDSVGAVDALRMNLSGSYARYFASVLTLMGLFGTFVGLTSAILGVEGVIDTLSNFTDLTRLQDSMKDTLGGMRTAFTTSLAGLATAMVLGAILLELGHLQARFVARLEDATTTDLLPLFLGPQGGTATRKAPAEATSRPADAAPRPADPATRAVS